MAAEMKMRCESDIVGKKLVPADAYYGVHTLRAVENFSITGQKLHPEMIVSLACLKKACAAANGAAGVLDHRIAEAIIQACDRIMAGEFHDQFLVDPIQGGAGTSMNMNANEVIANIAIELLGGEKGDYALVNPNDHVNFGQSTNDIVPTAGKLAILVHLESLEEKLGHLRDTLQKKGAEFDGIVKIGRTQLQDAVPIRLGQEFCAYASAVDRGLRRIRQTKQELYSINLGGTAVGTGINTNPIYYQTVTAVLSGITGISFSQAEDLIDATQNVDSFAAISAALKNCALTLSKIANDLRLLSSGPKAGLGEIHLPPRQNGSSIMPGKVNPVIPEVVNQVAFKVVGNDLTISMAVEAGQMELNAFEPVIFDALFQSITILGNAAVTFADNCIEGITADEARCKELLESSVGIVTALCPRIGYDRGAKLAKEALARHIPVRQLILEEKILTEEEIEIALNAYQLTLPGIDGDDQR